MTPTFHDGDLLLCRRRTHPLQRGCVVVFELHDESDSGRPFHIERLVKRVVAVAEELAPQWLLETGRLSPVVPRGHVAVAGDGDRSSSSAQFGYVPVSRIESVVIRRLAYRSS
jgi:hypothetical protein